MNKENNRSAAGLRRSAIAERIKLREEWSALKEIDTQPARSNVVKKQNNAKSKPPAREIRPPNSLQVGRLNRCESSPSSVLRGVVALVEVGSEGRALPLRAALSALGASVVPAWSPLITHLIWAQGGCRNTRARGRALACSLVSPLWVEACAAAARRLPDRAFPAAPRPSDLPSPAALRVMLKKAEAENISLFNLDNSDDKEKVPRLRISSETEHDTSADTTLDTSRDTSKDTSKDSTRDVSKDTTTDVESRVNTAPRRALPKMSESVSPVRKSKRRLFTNKEAEVHRTKSTDDEGDSIRPTIPKPKANANKATLPKVAKKPEADRRDLARAERLARKLLQATSNTQRTTKQPVPRIVLTGMCRTERREMMSLVSSLGGKLQSRVNKRTTHVVLGAFTDAPGSRTLPVCSGITNINISQEALRHALGPQNLEKARTLACLLGAARGCAVLRGAWLRDSASKGGWVRPAEYEVPHLRKMAQKARVERAALRKTQHDYAYDIFCGMRVFVTSNAEQRDAAIELLNLCGAVVIQDGGGNGGQDGRQTQNGWQHGQGLTQLDKLLGNKEKKMPPTQRTQHALITQKGEIRYDVVHSSNRYDIQIGVDVSQVSSKWVFDSVAAGRMRTTRRYVVEERSSDVVEVRHNFCIDDC